jgi:signal transduction histidine kinase
LVRYLIDHPFPVFIRTSQLPPELATEKGRISLLQTHLFLPLTSRDQLTGWIALGDRRSEDSYQKGDLLFLEKVSDLAAQAIERAQIVSNLEKRMHEMNVLTRVSQGINVTLAFDDILELLYAQTNQVIPTLDYTITLKDTYSENPYHVFYLENDERLADRENIPFSQDYGMEGKVIASGKAILTIDYERECRSRGVVPSFQGIFSWIGAPLNTGMETIGAICLGSRDSSQVYSEDQVELLKAIADQAAGAIIKGRLLQEAERRTYQLTVLNEIARSLSSTLELDRLLRQILNSAVEILNCEAGSLILCDQITNELVFEVVVGPVASDLTGRRLPAGTGLIGKAVETRQPIIANNVHHNEEWFEKPDQETGFKTQDVLVVPMAIKDRVIGVIEIINRKDKVTFTPDDLELLTAFTSQAAVAFENARLYTMTDQALASRVDELSVMQRIDRELNTNLDVGLAMGITLKWAMRQSGAEAGLIGSLEETGIQIIASAGYPTDLSGSAYPLLQRDSSLINLVLNVEPQRVWVEQENPDQYMLAGTRRQLVFLIRQESDVIGMLLLESSRLWDYSEDVLAFLSRLIDHAAIAISNARLYSEIQEVNNAKSKFVSFVAHELKNPMSSIKGYAELVAGGMAGPVNELQANFLATVSANVDRMNTIVSDLNDLTKIEMGNLRLDYRATSMNEITQDVLRSLRRQVEEKSLTILSQVPVDLPAVWGDPIRINQILTNLISNAIKYTPTSGKISLGAVKSSKLGEGPINDKEVLHIWIEDDGIGIPQEDQDNIFRQYFRTETAKEIASGTGLGLHITKTLVEMQRGSIWFESNVNEGTTFHFTLPLADTA